MGMDPRWLDVFREKGLVAAESRLPLPAPPAVGESEAEFTTRVIDLAHSLGWLAYHPIPLRTERGWATGTQGDRGYMDLTFARGGRILAAELKVGSNRLTPDQEKWLAASGCPVWRPEDWPEIVRVLTEG